MDTVRQALRDQTRAFWATVVCFVLGAGAALTLLWGDTLPFLGPDSLLVPIAMIAAITASVAFAVSTIVHHRGETRAMPAWQATVSNLTTIAVTAAFGGVAGLSVLLAGQLMSPGFQGLAFSAIGGSIMTGVASALAGRFSFQAGVNINTQDLAALLFMFLIVGTIFAMINEADATWWERNFSQLGIGTTGWAFNGTLIVAGLLVATIGSYIGRDLHRLLTDAALARITVVVFVWGGAGVALALVGVFPLDQQPTAHLIAAFAALALLVVAAAYTQYIFPTTPFVLKAVTTVMVVLVVLSLVLTFAVPILSATALEGIVVGLSLLWLTTFVRVLGILTPQESVPSRRQHLMVRSQPQLRW